MKKELLKKIIIFTIVVVCFVLGLKQAMINFNTKQEYENQKHQQNEILYKKYFGAVKGDYYEI